MDLHTEKKWLRTQMLQARDAIAQEQKNQWDNWFCNHLLNRMQALKANSLHAFWPMGSEPQIGPALAQLHQKGVCVYLPKIVGKGQLQFLLFDGAARLETGVFGTMHPANSSVFEGSAKLVLTPGLAFTAQGQRLGYGGGYYDRWLSEHPKAQRWAMAYPFQILEQLPKEPHDEGVNEVWQAT